MDATSHQWSVGGEAKLGMQTKVLDEVIKQPATTVRDGGDEGPAPSNGPLFVTGVWRSGTSLLYALLNQHPEIGLMYEEDLFHVHSLFWLRRDTPDWLAKWNAWNGALGRHKVDVDQIPRGISDLRSAAEAVYRQYARQTKNASIWGCKSPTYHDQLALLSRTFPNARFIIIWRDLTSICRSILKAAPGNLFFSRRGMLLRAIYGYRELKLQCDQLVRSGAQVHQLYYEDLVRDPASSMAAICDFLGIPLDARMTNLEGADRSAIEEGPHHSMVKSEKIVATRNGSKGLPAEVKAKIERYQRMWRRQYTDWPLYPESLDAAGPIPSAAEQMRDRVAYAGLSFWHHAAPIVFSMVPLIVWQKYRGIAHARRYIRSFRKQAPDRE
jgi:LPS sulfotransferase NodH